MSEKEGRYFRVAWSIGLVNCERSAIIGPFTDEELGGTFGDEKPSLDDCMEVVWEDLEVLPQEIPAEEAKEERGF